MNSPSSSFLPAGTSPMRLLLMGFFLGFLFSSFLAFLFVQTTSSTTTLPLALTQLNPFRSMKQSSQPTLLRIEESTLLQEVHRKSFADFHKELSKPELNPPSTPTLVPCSCPVPEPCPVLPPAVAPSASTQAVATFPTASLHPSSSSSTCVEDCPSTPSHSEGPMLQHLKFRPVKVLPQCNYGLGGQWVLTDELIANATKGVYPPSFPEGQLDITNLHPKDWTYHDARHYQQGRWASADVSQKYTYVPPSFPADSGCPPYRSFNAHRFLSKFRNRTLAFFGDSLIRQQFTQLVHELKAYQTSLNEFYMPSAMSTRYNPIRVYSYHEFGVVLKNQWLPGFGSLIDQIAPTMLRSDLLLVNIGAFMQQPEQFKRTLEEWIEFTVPSASASTSSSASSSTSFIPSISKPFRHYQGSAIWREYSPVHFMTSNGEFIADAHSPHFRAQMECQNPFVHPKKAESKQQQNPFIPEMSEFQRELSLDANKVFPPPDWTSPNLDRIPSQGERIDFHANWRLTVPNSIMSAAKAPILRIFDVSLDRVDLHPLGGKKDEEKDCRHWIFPSYLLRTWNELLDAMIVVEGDE